MSDHAVPDGSWRISDSDREAAARALGEHYATGRLDKAEYDERVDRAWAARTNLRAAPAVRRPPGPTAAWWRRVASEAARSARVVPAAPAGGGVAPVVARRPLLLIALVFGW